MLAFGSQLSFTSKFAVALATILALAVWGIFLRFAPRPLAVTLMSICTESASVVPDPPTVTLRRVICPSRWQSIAGVALVFRYCAQPCAGHIRGRPQVLIHCAGTQASWF